MVQSLHRNAILWAWPKTHSPPSSPVPAAVALVRRTYWRQTTSTTRRPSSPCPKGSKLSNNRVTSGLLTSTAPTATCRPSRGGTAEKRLKRPRDPLQLAKLIGDIATGQVEDRAEDSRDPNAVERGGKGGAVGGKARAQSLTPDQRRQSAQKAARARWHRP